MLLFGVFKEERSPYQTVFRVGPHAHALENIIDRADPEFVKNIQKFKIHRNVVVMADFGKYGILAGMFSHAANGNMY